MSSWLDAAIGWDKNFNKYETVLFDDPAIDEENSDISEFISGNLSTEHIKFKTGMKPVKMVITLPSPAQWSSIMPHIGSIGDNGSESVMVACHKLFEMCVSFPEEEALKHVMRDGFKRLPESFMGYVASQKSLYIEVYGNWIIGKYMLTGDEKKPSSQESGQKT